MLGAMSSSPASPPGIVRLGPEDAPAVVFLHGFLGQAMDWLPVMSAMADQYACIALDLPGHGASVGLAPSGYTGDGATRRILRTLDTLGIHRPALVGYSMGGRLALSLALQAPDRWRVLVLESASAGVEDTAARAARRVWEEAWAERLIAEPLPQVLRDWYAQPLFASLQRTPARLDALMAARAASSPSELARALRGLGVGTQPAMRHALPGLALPLLLLAGAEDARYLVITMEMRDLCPRAQRVIVPGAGHNVHLEQPAAFVETLQTYLGAHP